MFRARSANVCETCVQVITDTAPPSRHSISYLCDLEFRLKMSVVLKRKTNLNSRFNRFLETAKGLTLDQLERIKGTIYL